jgi:hypothetical protein
MSSRMPMSFPLLPYISRLPLNISQKSPRASPLGF